MDFKLDYMARLLRSIENKKFESYAIQRIWHLLDNEDVQFVVQQYFKRNDKKYALTDLYLPQINLVVEIDEVQHAADRNKILDAERTRDIKAINNAEVIRLPLYKNVEKDEWYSLSEFNDNIFNVVAYIKQKIKEQGGKFRPWIGEDAFSPEYYKKKGYLAVSENEYVKNIDDAAAIFNTRAKHRGYLRAAGFAVPNKENYMVWLPASNNRLWNNQISEDGKFIFEYQKTDEEKRKKHVSDILKNPEENRITFFREKDKLGFNFYKFVGVFKLNVQETIKQNKCVWERCAERYELNVNA